MFSPDKKPQKDPRFYYQIEIKGTLPDKWSEWFGGLTIESGKATDRIEVTVLNGPVWDLAALRGILVKLLDLNLELISVRQVLPPMEDQQQAGS